MSSAIMISTSMLPPMSTAMKLGIVCTGLSTTPFSRARRSSWRWTTSTGITGRLRRPRLSRLLQHLPKDRLLVLMMHVPLEVGGAGYVSDRQDFYHLLEGRKVLVL